MMIFIGSDHGGFRFKQKIMQYLDKIGVNYVDVGSYLMNPTDDYPDFALKMAKQVARSRTARGIFLCRSGAGACIVANKVKGIRATQAFNVRSAKMARLDDDANVLCLGADYISLDQAKKIIRVWLSTKFGTASRHRRRINKIKKIEKK